MFAYLGFEGTRRSSFASSGELRRCMLTDVALLFLIGKDGACSDDDRAAVRMDEVQKGFGEPPLTPGRAGALP